MLPDVKPSVEARINFFNQYMDVPEDMRGRVDAFIANVTALGEESADAAGFEAAFISTGLSDEFNSILPQCIPKAVPVSAEWKEEARKIRKEMSKELAPDFAKETAKSVIENAALYAKGEALRMNRERMIENGTFDDYTRLSNKIQDAQTAGGLLKKLFKKK